ncbi:MAG TPA: TMEM175 family protein [Rugosimonospora sp.]
MNRVVLELKTPPGHHLSDLVHTTGVGLLSYLLSFVYVGIYWNNHHHMFHLVERVRGGVLWANLALLFCLSLFPFTTAWMDDSRFSQTPTPRRSRCRLGRGGPGIVRVCSRRDHDRPGGGPGG